MTKLSPSAKARVLSELKWMIENDQLRAEQPPAPQPKKRRSP